MTGRPFFGDVADVEAGPDQVPPPAPFSGARTTGAATSPTLAGSREKALHVVDELIARERAARR